MNMIITVPAVNFTNKHDALHVHTCESQVRM